MAAVTESIPAADRWNMLTMPGSSGTTRPSGKMVAPASWVWLIEKTT
ncbi:MAG: hypothetical protein R2909_08240 [Gemmatimonadales bacterium]